MWSQGSRRDVPLYRRDRLVPGHSMAGPAIIVEATATVVVEPGWRAEVTDDGYLRLVHVDSGGALVEWAPTPASESDRSEHSERPDPVRLEFYGNRFMSIAEQMGERLRSSAHSVNIKERLDFSCALFDRHGQLVANAPHIPVHLGSMGQSVGAILSTFADDMQPGDAFLVNDPYAGGTHLPDITVVTPVFDAMQADVMAYVAARGHHADVGGLTPGSMPPHSTSIDQEGVRLSPMKLVAGGVLQEATLRAQLTASAYPARNPDQNLADLRAQLAANEKGAAELRKLVGERDRDEVERYMAHLQDNAELAVRRAIDSLVDGSFALELDNGARICVEVSVDRSTRSAVVDFAGTSPQQPSNFNAPRAVTVAAVLYVFRTLVQEELPLNAGCLRPLDIRIPRGSMLSPEPPAAVVAGNVETSMCVANALYGALGIMAASQCTMNNVTFGDAELQYYETLAGGAGAGPDFDGEDAVQSHMTNSRLTDPEVLELRFPVRVEEFAVRRGSGGRGRHRGGDGVIRRLRFLAPLRASVLSNGRRIPAFGLAGGLPGSPGRNAVEGADGHRQTLEHVDSRELDAGDVLVIETPGGGGFGTPEP